MELLDIYNENAEKTGRVIERGTPLRSGEYSLAVHLYIYNADGQFLLQKRSAQKKSLPGIWSVTCGAVMSGETSVQAGVREAAEELGLILLPERLRHIGRVKRRHSFIDIFFIRAEWEMSKLVLQKEEVDAVRLCRAGELLNIISETKNIGGTYLAAVSHAIRENGLS